MKRIKFRLQNKIKESHYPFQTDDHLVDISQKQFFKQQEQFLELQSNLRSFIKGIMNVTDAIDNMYSCFKGIYEPNWFGNVEFNHMCQESLKIWRQFIADFKVNIAKATDEYGGQFPDIKRAIEKRNKKHAELVKLRAVYENYRNAKKVDIGKTKKAEQDWKTSEQEYEQINNDMKLSLPDFCDRRLQIYIDLWTKLFEAEEAMFSFLQEGRKNQLVVLSRLSAAAATDQYSIKSQMMTGNGSDSNLLSTKAYAKSALTLINSERAPSAPHSPNLQLPSFPSSIVPTESAYNRTSSYQISNLPQSELSEIKRTNFFEFPSQKVTINKRTSFTQKSEVTVPINEYSKVYNNSEKGLRTPPYIDSENSSDIDSAASDHNPYAKIKSNGLRKPKVNQDSDVSNPYSNNFLYDNEEAQNRIHDRTNSLYDKRSQTTTSQESDVVDSYRNSTVYDTVDDRPYYYQVVATFDYHRRDDDELDLRVDDVILVLPWRSVDEMEEGWLFGENIESKEKGLFPENHTSKLDL